MCECVVVTQLTIVAHSFGNVHLKHTLTTCTFSIPHNISGLTMGHAKLFHFHVTEKKCSLFLYYLFSSHFCRIRSNTNAMKNFSYHYYITLWLLWCRRYVWKGSFLYAVHVENNEKISFYKLNVISEWVEIFFTDTIQWRCINVLWFFLFLLYSMHVVALAMVINIIQVINHRLKKENSEVKI